MSSTWMQQTRIDSVEIRLTWLISALSGQLVRLMSSSKVRALNTSVSCTSISSRSCCSISVPWRTLGSPGVHRETTMQKSWCKGMQTIAKAGMSRHLIAKAIPLIMPIRKSLADLLRFPDKIPPETTLNYLWNTLEGPAILHCIFHFRIFFLRRLQDVFPKQNCQLNSWATRSVATLCSACPQLQPLPCLLWIFPSAARATTGQQQWCPDTWQD